MSMVLVLSDTHMAGGQLAPKVQYYAERADYVFHAGDFTTKTAYDTLKGVCKGKLVTVIGNSDKNKDLLDALISNAKGSKDETGLTAYGEVDGIKIGMKHKHALGSDRDFIETNATEVANGMGVDVLIFGHIHQPVIVWGEGNKLLICPGRGGPDDPVTVKKCGIGTIAVLYVGNGKIDGARIIRTWQ